MMGMRHLRIHPTPTRENVEGCTPADLVGKKRLETFQSTQALVQSAFQPALSFSPASASHLISCLSRNRNRLEILPTGSL